MAKEEKEQFKTPEFRVSFPKLLKPEAYKEGDTPKYSVTMFFDKKAQASSEYKKIRGAAKKAFVEKFGKKEWDDTPKDSEGWPLGYFNPFKKATEKQLEKYPEIYDTDMVIMSASTQFQIPVVDEKVAKILDESVLYGGCYGWAYVVVNPYKNGTNKGVSFYLQAFQKTKDGEAFTGSGARAEDLFSKVSNDDDNGFDDESDNSDENYDF